MKSFLLIKARIFFQKLFFNSYNYLHSNRIKDFQDNSLFIKFLRENLLRLDDSNNIKNQIKKNLLRSISFYSLDLIQLAKLVHENVTEVLVKEKLYDPVFFSKPYLMIHLPSDKSEEGTMHSDYEYTEAGFFTCWVPLSNYNYPPISTVNRLAQIISAFPKTNQLLNFFKNNNICAVSKPGDVHFWSHSFMHKGNRNESESTSFVLVTKLSKEPLKIGGYHIENGEAIYRNEVIDFKKIDYDYLCKLVENFLLDVNLSVANRDFYKLINLLGFLIKNESNENLKIVSFFCSMLAQRIWLRPDFFRSLKGFNTESPLELCVILDVFSLIFGFQNHSSFERLKKSNISFLPDYFQKHIQESLTETDLIESNDKKELLKFFN
jgi:hypothetical protein